MYKKYLFSTLCILFLACQKDNDPQVEEAKKNCRLTKMIQGLHNGAENDTTFTFYYDSSGKLSKVTKFSRSSTSDWLMYYDDQNRLIKTDGYGVTEFFYNNNGLLSEIQYVEFARPVKLVFEYGADTVPSSATNYQYSGGQWLEQAKYHYTYQNGNVVTVESFYGGVSYGKKYFEYYADIPHGFKMLSLIDMHYHGLGFYENFNYFNKNMMKNEYDYRLFDYTLDSGKVVKSVSYGMSSNDTTNIEARFFYYECQ